MNLSGKGRFFSKNGAILVVMLTILMLVLAACGDPTATTAPATTAAATTAAATTTAAAATTAAATTAAATTTAAAATTTSAATTAAATTGGTLVIGTGFKSKALDPGREYTETAFMVFHNVYQNLVTYKGSDLAKVVPDAAESWTISPDGKTYSFKLKAGLKFVSGNPVTADDVVFSYKRLQNLKGQPAFVTANMTKFEATDATTVAITLKEVGPDTLSLLTTPSFAIIDSKIAKANGATDADDADKSDKSETFMNNQSIGSGPYVMKSYKPDTEIDLEKNPNFSGNVSYSKIIIKNLPDANVQQASLEKGDIDFSLDIGAEQAANLKGKSGVSVYQGTSLNIFFVLMNADATISGPTAKVEVRQAIRYAINYKDFLELGGAGSVQPPSVIPVGFAGALDKSEAIGTDLTKAKELMSKAGYANGFKIRMSYPSDLTQNGVKFETMAQKIQADLAQINITVDLDPKTIQVWLDAYRAGKEPLTLSLWGPDYIDPSDYLTFFPGQKLALRAAWPAGADAAMEDLAKKAAVELDEAKRQSYYQQAQKLLNVTGPWAPFLQPSQAIGYRSNISGFVYNPVWVTSFNETSKK